MGHTLKSTLDSVWHLIRRIMWPTWENVHNYNHYYIYIAIHTVINNLPHHADKLNQFMCDQVHQNHTLCGKQRWEGLLCGKCQSGLGPTVQYTHQCVECQWYGWLLYIASVFIPATVLCLIIILLRINLFSSPMSALVLLCDTMVSYANTTPY